MPHPPNPLSDLMARFVEDVLFPRMEQEFDRLAESMRNKPKPKRLPKQGPHKAQRVHKAQAQPKAKTPKAKAPKTAKAKAPAATATA